MEFTLKAHSGDFIYSVFNFPGDEAIDSKLYRKCTKTGYASSVSTITGGAMGFGLDIDTETFERWKRLFSVAGLLDDFLDEYPDREQTSLLYDEGLSTAFSSIEEIHPPNWANPLLVPAIKLLSNSVAVLPQNQIDYLFESARCIGNIVRKKIDCRDIYDYVEILQLEAKHTSNLIHGSVSENVYHQTNFSEFSMWVDNAMELGTLANSAKDIWSDKRDGIINIDATILNSAKIALNLRRPYRRMTHPKTNLKATFSSLLSRKNFYS